MKAEIWEGGSFTHLGCEIHYWTAGPQQKPLIIFIHGIGVDYHMFDTHIQDLTSVYRVLVWDLRGHGQSQPKGQPFSVALAAKDLLMLLQHVGVSKAILVGASIGGNIALMAAALAPEKIVGLVLIGSGNQWLKLNLWNKICIRAIVLYSRVFPLRLFQKVFSFLASVKREVRGTIYSSWKLTNARDFIEVWEAFYAAYHDEQRKVLECPACPILVIQGQYDITADYRKQWRTWRHAATHLRCVTIPGAGHVAHNDDPVLFNRLLINYITELMQDQSSDELGMSKIDPPLEPV